MIADLVTGIGFILSIIMVGFYADYKIKNEQKPEEKKCLKNQVISKRPVKHQ